MLNFYLLLTLEVGVDHKDLLLRKELSRTIKEGI